MAVKFSIGSKVFGLAVLLTAIMICLAGFLLVHVVQLQGALTEVATEELPLATIFADVNESGLRRRIAFERWYGALNSGRADPVTVAEAEKNYALFTDRLNADMARATQLLKTKGHAGDNRFAEIRALLEQMRVEYPVLMQRQHEVLGLLQTGKADRANASLGMLNDLQRIIQDQREQLQDKVFEITGASTQMAAAQVQRAVTVSIAASLCSMALGLVLAGFITRRLVRPVHTLIDGIRDVEKGDLSVELPISSSDEVALLTTSFNYFIRELRAKEEIKKTFGRYLDPQILERVISGQGKPETGGGRQVMSVSFSDIAGFSTLSEQLTPSGMVNLLNRHFTLQSEAIQKHLGIVDKFIGDAVMAFWGPPFIADQEHALLSCVAALTQMEALEQFRKELPELTGLRKNIPHVELRIGVSTGELVVGNLGSENARSYTVIGDTVNLGSRLEGANKVYGTKILISELTAQAAGGSVLVREMDWLVVKGKTEPIRVYELIGMQKTASATQLSGVALFAEGLSAYRRQQWDVAESSFRRCLDLMPQDGPSLLYLKRIADWRENPPAGNWDGIWRMDSK